MGIGNSVASRKTACNRCPLITPHGDRKPGRSETRSRRRGVRLITPHGDRKLLRGGGLPADPRRALITPHGDRKPSRPPDCRRRPRASHYPSWGSEPPERPGRHYQSTFLITPHGDRKPAAATAIESCGCRRSSLPLMGIGNCCSSRRARRCSGSMAAHYPSWGSETGRGARLSDPRGRLITPHGDRKPSARGCGACSADSSLPLMGIGNREGIRLRLGAGGGLITPHGDRKPVPPPRDRRSCLSTHYPSWGSETGSAICGARPSAPWSSLPLMGIGNFGPLLAAGQPPDRAQLITPHGDRKLESRIERYGTGGEQAHYPSWGSETRLPLNGTSSKEKASLPLMGIGNLVVRRIYGAHITDSLPLMGIGNPAACAGRRRPPPAPLITPHGDRKRYLAESVAGVRRASLPLMGIGNRRPA